MGILDKIRERNGLPVSSKSQAQSTDGHSVQTRLNFMTLGNTVELGTEIIHTLLKSNNGLSDQVGDQRLLKRDIADMIGGRIAARIQQTISTEKE